MFAHRLVDSTDPDMPSLVNPATVADGHRLGDLVLA
jgi:hypothetical protein